MIAHEFSFNGRDGARKCATHFHIRESAYDEWEGMQNMTEKWQTTRNTSIKLQSTMRIVHKISMLIKNEQAGKWMEEEWANERVSERVSKSASKWARK